MTCERQKNIKLHKARDSNMFNCASFQWCRKKKCGNTAERTLIEEISVAKANAQVGVDLPIYAGKDYVLDFFKEKV